MCSCKRINNSEEEQEENDLKKSPKKPFMQFSNFNKTNLDVKAACKAKEVKKTSYNTTQIPFRQKQHTSFTV